MKKIYLIALTLVSTVSFGQVSITAINTAYNDNFDSMTPTGTAFPANWNAIRGAGTGTIGQVLVMQVTDGSANTGTIYNTGTTNATDRSLGCISSNSTLPTFGSSFVNNTGGIITEFQINAVVEQWRTGSVNTFNEVMSFSYSLDATGLDNGTWTNVSSLNANEILTTTTASAAVDGNLPANQANILATIDIRSTPLANGSTLWIRWQDDNATGNDSLLAIDNFSFNATSNSLSTTDFGNISGLKVFPNPAKNVLNITSDSFEAKTVELYNVLGKKVLATTVTNAPINIAALAKGVYVVKITEEGKSATRRLVIE